MRRGSALFVFFSFLFSTCAIDLHMFGMEAEFWHIIYFIL